LAFLRLVVELVARRRRGSVSGGRERLHAGLRQVRWRLPRLSIRSRPARRGARHHQLGREPAHLHRHRGRARQRQGVGRGADGVQAEPLAWGSEEGGRDPGGIQLRTLTVRLILALLTLLSALPALAGSPRFVDYVYIEANEGGSSGGHTAMRFGDETYHFQHEYLGLLRLHRDDWQHFRDGYGVLENRTMHVSRVAVSDATYEELRRRFNERYLIERRLFEHRDALHDDRALLELLLARRRGDPTGTTRLRGAGFFFPEEAGTAECDAIVALRRRVREM